MEEARQHSALNPPSHPDARAFAADRLVESERMALAYAGAPLALLVTQLGTLAEASDWVRAAATVSLLCFVYCCVWQVHIVNYATYWLAAERLRDDGVERAGRDMLRAFHVRENFTEQGLTTLIRRSRMHYTLAYWVGGSIGLLAAFGVIWQ